VAGPKIKRKRGIEDPDGGQILSGGRLGKMVTLLVG